MPKKRVVPKGDQFAKLVRAEPDYVSVVRQIENALQEKRRGVTVIPADPAVTITRGGMVLKRFAKPKLGTAKGGLKLAKDVYVAPPTDKVTGSYQRFSVGKPATTATELPKAKLKMIERLLVSLPRS